MGPLACARAGLQPAHRGELHRLPRWPAAACGQSRSPLSQAPFQRACHRLREVHGPGELHVKARLAGERAPEQGDPTIANPDRMPRWPANNTCMFCHEKGDAEVLQPALAPYTPSFYLLLSSCYEVMGSRQAAVVSIQNGLRLLPGDTVMVEQLKELRAGAFKPSN